MLSRTNDRDGGPASSQKRPVSARFGRGPKRSVVSFAVADEGACELKFATTDLQDNSSVPSGDGEIAKQLR
jgi:hypothetical protein